MIERMQDLMKPLAQIPSGRQEAAE